MFKARVDQLVYDFNCRPLDYIDTSWLDDHERAPIERLTRSTDPQARAQASAWLLRRFALDDESDFDFAQPARRVMLLDPATLRDLALFLGLSALGRWLRTWVERAQQLHLRETVGESAFDWYVAHVLPRAPVARWSMEREQAERLLRSPQLLHVAARVGSQLLLGADTPGGPAMRRAQLKLPRATAELRRDKPLSDARREAIAEFCIGCVIRERHPQWHWLF